jgi:anti-anti-sigma factor
VRTRDNRAGRQTKRPIDLDDLTFTLSVSTEGSQRVIEICGELDVASRNLVIRACLADPDKAVIVEMAEMTFMDCRGYGGLLVARQALQQHGSSLSLRNQSGQPAALLGLLSSLEARRSLHVDGVSRGLDEFGELVECHISD